MKNKIKGIIFLNIYCFATFHVMVIGTENKLQLRRLEDNFSISNKTKNPVGIIIVDKNLAKKNSHHGFYLNSKQYKNESTVRYLVNTEGPLYIAIWEKLPKQKITMNLTNFLVPIFQPSGYKLFKITPHNDQGSNQVIHLDWYGGQAKGQFVLRPSVTGPFNYFKHDNTLINNIFQNQIEAITTLGVP